MMTHPGAACTNDDQCFGSYYCNPTTRKCGQYLYPALAFSLLGLHPNILGLRLMRCKASFFISCTLLEQQQCSLAAPLPCPRAHQSCQTQCLFVSAFLNRQRLVLPTVKLGLPRASSELHVADVVFYFFQATSLQQPCMCQQNGDHICMQQVHTLLSVLVMDS